MTVTRKTLNRHILLPAIMPLLFLGIAMLPVEVLGCRNRGLAALLIALASGCAAVTTAVRGLKGRIGGNPDAGWWMISALILTVPVVALLILA